MVLSDRQIKVHEIFEPTGDISQDIVLLILHEKLVIRKISARRVSRLLSVENKLICAVDFEAVLVPFRHNPESFCIDT